MTRQVETPPHAPPPVDWDREVQELIELLVEAVLALPDSEKRSVLDKVIAPLFEALLTLQKVPGIGLIWMALLGSGYPDYASRLPPLDRWCQHETHATPLGSLDVAEFKDRPMSRKKPRRPSVRRSKPKSAARRPVNTEIGMLVIDLGRGPAGTPADIAKTLDREWLRSHPFRSHRLRRTIAGEFPEETGDWVLIRQLQPGLRLRLPFKALAQFPSGGAPEHIAHAGRKEETSSPKTGQVESPLVRRVPRSMLLSFFWHADRRGAHNRVPPTLTRPGRRMTNG